MKLASLIFICLLLNIGGVLCGQGTNTIEEKLNLDKDVQELNAKIKKLLLKEDQRYENEKINICHIYFLIYKGDSLMHDFFENTFIDNLIPAYNPQPKGSRKYALVETEALIGDSSGCLIATSDGWTTYLARNYNSTLAKYNQKLLDLYVTEKFDYLFYLNSFPVSTFFGVKTNILFAFHSTIDGYDRIPIREFIACCWQKEYKPIK
jgi:hypothetical protein